MSDSKSSNGRHQSDKDLIVSRYRIEKKINKSDRGTTYLVTDTKNNNELYVYIIIYVYIQFLGL